jgi:hypothetical protein
VFAGAHSLRNLSHAPSTEQSEPSQHAVPLHKNVQVVAVETGGRRPNNNIVNNLGFDFYKHH